jgi:hypothetical protein
LLIFLAELDAFSFFPAVFLGDDDDDLRDLDLESFGFLAASGEGTTLLARTDVFRFLEPAMVAPERSPVSGWRFSFSIVDARLDSEVVGVNTLVEDFLRPGEAIALVDVEGVSKNTEKLRPDIIKVGLGRARRYDTILGPKLIQKRRQKYENEGADEARQDW